MSETSNTRIDEHALLEAAAACFGRLGLKKTGMQDIADAAGISRAALYLRFKNKQAVLEAVFTRAYEDGVDAAEDAAAEADRPLPLYEILNAYYTALYDVLAGLGDEPELRRLKAGPFRVPIEAARARLHACIVAAIRKDGKLSAGETPAALAEMIVRVPHAMAYQVDGPDDFRAQIKLFAETVRKGLLNPNRC